MTKQSPDVTVLTHMDTGLNKVILATALLLVSDAKGHSIIGLLFTIKFCI